MFYGTRSLRDTTFILLATMLTPPTQALVSGMTPSNGYTSGYTGSPGTYTYPTTPNTDAPSNDNPNFSSGLNTQANQNGGSLGSTVTSVSSSSAVGKGPPSISSGTDAGMKLLHPSTTDQVQTVSGPILPDPMSVEEVEGFIMLNSISAYPGRCACPYSINSDGFECGVESAYYQPGGYRIYCYPQDIRGQQYIFYRKTH